AGSRAQLSKLMERAGSPPGQPQVQQRLATQLQTGTPDEKARALETLAKYFRLYGGPNAGDAEKNLIMRAAEAVHRGLDDPDPTVHAWASYLSTVMTGDKDAQAAMLSDPFWLGRLFGVLATDFVNAPRDLLKPVARGDGDPVVRKLAAAGLAVPMRVAATQPATQPTTAPATGTPLTGAPIIGAPTSAAP